MPDNWPEIIFILLIAGSIYYMTQRQKAKKEEAEKDVEAEIEEVKAEEEKKEGAEIEEVEEENSLKEEK